MYTEPNVNTAGSLKRKTAYMRFKRVQDVILSTLGLILLFRMMKKPSPGGRCPSPQTGADEGRN